MGGVLSLVGLAIKYGPLLGQLVPLAIEAGQALAPIAQRAGQAIAQHMAAQAARPAAPPDDAGQRAASSGPTSAEVVSANPAVDNGLAAASGAGG